MLQLAHESSTAREPRSARAWTALVLCLVACFTCLPPFALPFAVGTENVGNSSVTIRVSLLSSSVYRDGKMIETTKVQDQHCSAFRLWSILGLVCTAASAACNVAALLLWSCWKLKGSSKACMFTSLLFLLLCITCMTVVFTRSMCGLPSLRDSGYSLSTSGFICTCIGTVAFGVGAGIVTRRRSIRRAIRRELQQRQQGLSVSSPLLAHEHIPSEVVSGVVVATANIPTPKFELAAVSAVADFLQHVMDDVSDVATIVIIPPAEGGADGARRRQQNPASFTRTVLHRGKRSEVSEAVVNLVSEIQGSRDPRQPAESSVSCLWDGIAAATGHFFVHARQDKVWVCLIVAATADNGSGGETASSVATILSGFAGHRPENQVIFINVDGNTPAEDVAQVRSQCPGSVVINAQHGPRMATTYGPEATINSALAVVASHLVVKPQTCAELSDEARRIAHRGPQPIVDQLIHHSYGAARAARTRASERFRNLLPNEQPCIDYLVVLDFSRRE